MVDNSSRWRCRQIASAAICSSINHHSRCRDKVWAVKWYRGNFEIFRYIADETPPTKVFKLDNFDVDVSNTHIYCDHFSSDFHVHLMILVMLLLLTSQFIFSDQFSSKYFFSFFTLFPILQVSFQNISYSILEMEKQEKSAIHIDQVF